MEVSPRAVGKGTQCLVTSSEPEAELKRRNPNKISCKSFIYSHKHLEPETQPAGQDQEGSSRPPEAQGDLTQGPSGVRSIGCPSVSALEAKATENNS